MSSFIEVVLLIAGLIICVFGGTALVLYVLEKAINWLTGDDSEF